MVQAKELRLGNLVYNRHGEIHEVRENTFQLFRYPTMDGDPAKLKGIPLTPEILENVGFARNIEGWVLSSDNMLYDPLVIGCVGDYTQNDTKVFAFKHGNNILKRGIRYVHQLQNLYFALTGEELQIDL